MAHLGGSLILGDHTTYVEAADPILQYLIKGAERLGIRGISLGFINTIQSRQTSEVRVKITIQETCLLLCITGKRAVQEMRVYSNSSQKTAEEIVRVVNGLKPKGYKVSFGTHYHVIDKAYSYANS